MVTILSDPFPPWAFTRFSNAALEAMMLPGQPPRLRVFACYVRFSWVYGSEFVVPPNGEAATQAEMAKKLSLSRTHLNNTHVSLVADGWLIPDDQGRIIPNPTPPGRAAPAIKSLRSTSLPSRRSMKTVAISFGAGGQR
jgi:hypothetical protein